MQTFEYTNHNLVVTYDETEKRNNVTIGPYVQGEIKHNGTEYVYHPYGADLTWNMCFVMSDVLRKLNQKQ